MNAKAMGAYTAAEFKAGFAALGVSSMDEFKRKLPNLYQEMKTPEGFKVMYKFVFDFARDQSFKNMQIEMAIDLWELLLSSKCRFLPDWVDFIKQEKKD